MATPSLLKESATEPARTDWERRQASLDERQRTLTVIAALELDGTRITFTTVARAASVSAWHQQHCAWNSTWSAKTSRARRARGRPQRR
ncbi:hypothetical protein ACFRCW_45170 [Streptomyces sp. NPDC056653]|uniref:hypothetical protein n=1 Tax=Streptomyces sp. NPDC056653 TaxID=3345894 RepID=UPI00368AFF11